VQPGGEVISHEESHIYKYEGGGIAKNSGASVRLLKGDRGRIDAETIEQWINPPLDVHFPLTQLVSLEDTANRGGGAVYDFKQILEIKALCDKLGLPLHLDGARVCNALAVNHVNPQEYGAAFDSISICLSKGLGAPVGSVLVGTREFIHKARRVRKVMGGGMRQAGIIAAGGLYALTHNRERLVEDHLHAKQLEQTFLKQNWVDSVLGVETNIVVVQLKNAAKRDEILAQFMSFGIQAMAFGPGMLRFVTHLDVSSTDIDFTCEKIGEITN
jgi:threonine aldolase